MKSFVRNLRARRLLCAGALLGCSSLLSLGCGDRRAAYGQPFSAGDPVGLTGSVALADLNRNEMMMLTSPSEGKLDVQRIKVGKNIVSTTPSFDRQQLFVLTAGDARRIQATDEPPQLFVISGGFAPSLDKTYVLDNELQKLAIDPSGEWAVIYDGQGVVVNDNELILVDLKSDDTQLIEKTIRSHGSKPVRFTFTDPLRVPGGGAHRVLAVETDQDVSLIDLENPDAPEFTVELPHTQNDSIAQPAQIVFHDGDTSADGEGSYLAVRFANDTSVLTLSVAAPSAAASAAGHEFSVIPNLVDAGALPSAIDFVVTERGLRLAALVPTQSLALLFDPATSKSEQVKFDQPYSGLARVTQWVDGASANADVALLYSNTASSIAFWRLGAASSTPYASFDSYAVDTQVSNVVDIPGQDFGFMKVLLGASGSEFFLLDLKSRLSYPMRALSGFNLRLAPDGERAWAFTKGGLDIARLTFADRHPASFPVERAVSDVFDVARADGGRSALVLHETFDIGVTVFDALEPDSANTRFVSGLKLEGW